jgi:hypothetical protein
MLEKSEAYGLRIKRNLMEGFYKMKVFRKYMNAE